MKKTTHPSQPLSRQQLSQRAIVGFLRKRWATINAFDKASWLSHPYANNTSPYHGYLRENLNRWARQLGPSARFPATEDDGLQAGTLEKLNTHLRSVTLRYVPGDANHCWGVAIGRSSFPPHALTWDEVETILRIDVDETMDFNFYVGQGTTGVLRARELGVAGSTFSCPSIVGWAT